MLGDTYNAQKNASIIYLGLVPGMIGVVQLMAVPSTRTAPKIGTEEEAEMATFQTWRREPTLMGGWLPGQTWKRELTWLSGWLY